MRRTSAKRNALTAWTWVTEAREIWLKGRAGFHVRPDDEEQKWSMCPAPARNIRNEPTKSETTAMYLYTGGNKIAQTLFNNHLDTIKPK